ncbi:arylsulfatase [Fulvivirgaceae bacterium BMA10]|uniref:Arylsulfatase n=1 Tax=Splendidivirga corallicola TaxID=3051826 RepID=A0ABT8KNA3_9BACT|nr:arylsulfatase [Fulvivirgaceae bacterium BMA10]
MQYKNFEITKIILALVLILVSSCQTSQEKSKQETAKLPNIIYILADDLGYGDLSCYGQQKFQTPNIDALAANGIKFTQHYSGSTVCAPSRSALMTGQHTGRTPIRGNKEVRPEGQHPIDDGVITLAEVLKQKGYATGAFGKWGLGFPGSEGDPVKQGFDTFYGYNCQRIGHNYYPYHLWHNDQKVMLEENEDDKEGAYAPQLIHEQTLTFIEAHKDRPFFAYVPSIIPHAELKVPEKYMAKYRGKLEPEKSFKGCDADCDHYKIGGYGSQPEAHATFAAMIDLLDQQVGEIVAKVKALGIEDNTLIIFTSDNGPHMEGGADPDYFDSNGVLRGYKRDLYEGGIRVPMIASWPGKIKEGATTNHISAFWDVLPTLAEMAEIQTPQDVDGISFLPTLLGKEQPKHDYLYWEFHERGGRRAIRKDNWKLVLYDLKKDNPKQPELYDLDADPSEQNNIADQHPEILEQLQEMMKNRTTSPVDSWNFKAAL